ncbi:uncharacterized protein LOC124720142 isoform X3 [Schistocerca piceifrons]|uniref:uncharacterized protein LOC124720142 isoform X3 n=1 Tax=Schistocerca piceifrons TaxID=274613 RepID=UPI001F5F1A12|nr:uncharacterized protein LOC124720142 isoform X3 [Schistocerca piceifrons]
MHDLNSKNVTEDPIKIPGQSDEVVPLTSVQIFVKEEQFINDQVDEAAILSPVQIFLKEEEGIRDQLEEVVPLSPVQVFLKEEESAYCKAEEPVLVSLVPVLPKEEHVVNESPEDFEEGSGPLVINLENSSSEDWSNHSDPLAIEQTAANASYVEYVETGEPVLVDLGATSSEVSSRPLRSSASCGNISVEEVGAKEENTPSEDFMIAVMIELQVARCGTHDQGR